MFLYLLFFSVTVGWLEEGVLHDASHHGNSVKKMEKCCHALWKARTIIGMVRGGGIPLEYARDAGKIEEKIGVGGTPSFMKGQPGILMEMTGVTQPISMKRVTHVMSVTSYLSCGRGLSSGNKSRGSPLPLLSLSRIFCEGEYKGKRFHLEAQ